MQIAAIVEQKPEIVDLAMSDRDVVVQNLIGTGGGHFEVNGEAAIRQQVPVANSRSWSGAYMHTPAENEAVLGYRAESGTVVSGPANSNKAVWGITKGGAVYGELGSTYQKDAGIGINPPPAIDDAYGVYGVANDPDATKNYGVYGISNKANGVGIYGRNTVTGGRAGLFDGPLEQGVSYGGVVKAAAYVECGVGSSMPLIKRHFRPSDAGVFKLTVLSGGHCILDFGFDISQRYFQATAASAGAAATVACEFGSSANELNCTRYLSTGSTEKGPIMVTIY